MSDQAAAQFNIHDAKTNLSRIIERVEHGEEIIISRAGRPVAKVIPLAGRVQRSARGSLRGSWAGAGLGFRCGQRVIATEFDGIVSLLLDTLSCCGGWPMLPSCRMRSRIG